MSEDNRKSSVQAAEVTVFQAGEQITPQGFESPWFYVILSGQVMLSQDGTKLRTLGEQDIFGLESLLLKRPAHYAAEAVHSCRIASYGPEVLDQLIRQSPRMVEGVLVSILRQLTQTAQNLLEPSSQALPAEKKSLRFFSDGEAIVEETGSEWALYRLITGRCKVSGAGREITQISRPGDFFGAPLSPRNCCVRSIGQSVVEKYGAGDLDTIIRDYPDAALRIMEAMIERERAACRR
ncbi:MAG: cyclic nucleotide-binding domain-containing protein [Syntrophobacteraceae bacterium]